LAHEAQSADWGFFVLGATNVTIDSGNLPLVLRKSDVARLLDKSERTVERFQRAGMLPDQVVPGRWSRETFIQWLAGGSTRRSRR
jgi:hypothetical protein